MKYLSITVLLFLAIGCSGHREYTKIYNGAGTSNVEVDKAQCEMEAEKSTSSSNLTTVVNVNTGSKLTKKERKELRREQYQKENSDRLARSSQVSKLKDLCLKSKGWSWKYIKD